MFESTRRNTSLAFLAAALSCVVPSAYQAQSIIPATLTRVDGTTAAVQVVEQTFLATSEGVLLHEDGASPSHVPAADIRALHLSDGEVFVRVASGVASQDGRRVTVDRLARQLKDGHSKLYELYVAPGKRLGDRIYDNGKVYYVDPGDEQTYELVRSEARLETRVTYVNSYVSTLRFLLQQCPQTAVQLERRGVSYTASALSRLLRVYDECVGHEAANDDGPPSKVNLGTFVRAGYLATREQQSIPVHHGFTTGAAIEFTAPRISSRLSWRIGLEYARYRVDYITDRFPRCINVTPRPTICQSVEHLYIFDYAVPVVSLPLTLRMQLTRPHRLTPFLESGLTFMKQGDSKVQPALRLGPGATFGAWEIWSLIESKTLQDFTNFQWYASAGASLRVWSSKRTAAQSN